MEEGKTVIALFILIIVSVAARFAADRIVEPYMRRGATLVYRVAHMLFYAVCVYHVGYHLFIGQFVEIWQRGVNVMLPESMYAAAAICIVFAWYVVAMLRQMMEKLAAGIVIKASRK